MQKCCKSISLRGIDSSARTANVPGRSLPATLDWQKTFMMSYDVTMLPFLKEPLALKFGYAPMTAAGQADVNSDIIRLKRVFGVCLLRFTELCC